MIQQAKRRAHHRELPRLIIRLSERCAEAKGHRQRARRPHALGDRSDERDADRRDPMLLEYSGNQSHGLSAERSHRYQESGLHAVVQKNLRCLGCALPHEPPGRWYRPVEAEMPWCGGSNCAARDERA